MAATQPDEKNTGILTKGVPRSLVIAELGIPVSSEKKDGNRTDIFTFYKGSNKGWKVGRTVFHSAADIMTLGLWEIVGTPTELLVKGDRLTATVKYDENDKVESWVLIGDEDTNQAQPSSSSSEEDF